jgi:C4-dicarboxylate transporter, DctQ subunit
MAWDMKKSSTFVPRIGAVYNGIMNFFVVFAGILLSFAALSVAAGISTRYFFDYPLPWVTEIAEFSLLYLPFLLGVWVLRKDSHVKMDIILNLFPRKVQNVINTITSIMCALICLVVGIFAVKVMHDQYLSNAFTYTILEIPKWILTIVIFLGSFMLVIEFFCKAYGYATLVNPPEGQNRSATPLKNQPQGDLT